VVGPGRQPWSISACRTQLRSYSYPMPSCWGDAAHHGLVLAVAPVRLQDHPDRPLTQLSGVPALGGVLALFHVSIFSKRRGLHQSQGGPALRNAKNSRRTNLSHGSR
jgi:hypothetical protein